MTDEIKSQIKQLFYQCNACKKKRHVNINIQYHERKAKGGLTKYNDFHICVDDQFKPTFLSVDRHYSVRGQSQGLGAAPAKPKKPSFIPAPTVKMEATEMNYKEVILPNFPYIRVKNKVGLNEYYLGSQLAETQLYEVKSPSGLFSISFQINPEFNDHIDTIIARFDDASVSMDTCKALDTEVLSSLVRYVAQNMGLDNDVVDREIMLQMTSASTIWMKPCNEFSSSYVDRHLHGLIPDEAIETAKVLLTELEKDNRSLEEISNTSSLDLSGTVSVSFILEMLGILKFEYIERMEVM